MASDLSSWHNLKFGVFMNSKAIAILIAASFSLSSSLLVFADNENSINLALFGVSLKNASRDQIREAVKKNGMRAIREDLSYWVDVYDPNDVLENATEFEAGYVSKTGKFAYAKYTFQSFMDTRLVENVVNMVSKKYGMPSTKSGNYNLGRVSAQWNLNDGMQIDVYRGWPDTTTYLTYKDTNNYFEMNKEIDILKKSEEDKKIESQSHAF